MNNKTDGISDALRAELKQELRNEMRRKKKRRTLLGLVILLLLLLIGSCGAHFLYKDYQEKEAKRIQEELDAEIGILPGMSEDEIRDRLNRKVAEGRLNISINPMPEFADGESEGNIRIENIQGNQYAFVVTIQCIGASEDPGAQDYVGATVMTTGLINPGSYVEDKKLDIDLPMGKYTCVATFTAYDSEQNEAGSVGTQILITVLQ